MDLFLARQAHINQHYVVVTFDDRRQEIWRWTTVIKTNLDLTRISRNMRDLLNYINPREETRRCLCDLNHSWKVLVPNGTIPSENGRRIVKLTLLANNFPIDPTKDRLRAKNFPLIIRYEQ